MAVMSRTIARKLHKSNTFDARYATFPAIGSGADHANCSTHLCPSGLNAVTRSQRPLRTRAIQKAALTAACVYATDSTLPLQPVSPHAACASPR